jgi:hypothetical protein
MSRAIVLVPFFALWLAAPGEALAQRDSRFKSGNIEVVHDLTFYEENGGRTTDELYFHQLLRDRIAFGLCYEAVRYRRMPTTYYHPRGPIGVAFQRYNWFPGPTNTYHADARLAVSLVGEGAGLGLANLHVGMLESLWTEPPVAVIGMAAGTPASYARPLQQFHFFEANKDIIDLNQRTGKDVFFHFISDAQARGAELKFIQGSDRRALRDSAPTNFYKLMILEACTGEDREKIALDLLTKEGIAECFEHLADDGILCVHTSHRFIDMPPVLGAIGKELKLSTMRALDSESDRDFDRGRPNLAQVGHWTSEWVMMSRHKKTLDRICQPPEAYKGDEQYWTEPRPFDHVWTEKGPNLLDGVLRGHPVSMWYSEAAEPVVNVMSKAARVVGLNGGRAQAFIRNLHYLPAPVADWYVRWQLDRSPRVETLWP